MSRHRRLILSVALIAVGISSMAVGCGQMERAVATATGYSTICVEGVSYLQFTSGATVQYNKEGTIKTCGESGR